VALSPDVIFAFTSSQLGPVSREMRTIPVVFVGASDPVGIGYVASSLDGLSWLYGLI
jgi:putative ABC transport system substrate-binding protein